MPDTDNVLTEEDITRIYGILWSHLYTLSVQQIRNTAAAAGFDITKITDKAEASGYGGSRAEVMPAIDRLFGGMTVKAKNNALRVLAKRLIEMDAQLADGVHKLLDEHGLQFVDGNFRRAVHNKQTSPEERDDLIPLYRRRVFDRDLVAMVNEAARAREPLTLVMIDLDRFKQVNDEHGHRVGDEVLLATSELVNRRVRGKGKAYRYGGEEIALLLPNYSVDEAVVLAEMLRKDLEGTPLSSRRLTITASFGLACVPDHASDPAALVEKADAALYEAKDLGRNYVRISGEPRPSNPSPREIRRREPESGGLSEKQKDEIRLQYFRTGQVRCPNDQALLEVKESGTMGKSTRDLLISCGYCGLLEDLSGE